MSEQEFHVGLGTTSIYAGTIKKRPTKYAQEHRLNEWLHKSDVTDEAISAVAQYLVEHNQILRFSLNGARYVLSATEIAEDSK